MKTINIKTYSSIFEMKNLSIHEKWNYKRHYSFLTELKLV